MVEGAFRGVVFLGEQSLLEGVVLVETGLKQRVFPVVGEEEIHVLVSVRDSEEVGAEVYHLLRLLLHLLIIGYGLLHLLL